MSGYNSPTQSGPSSLAAQRQFLIKLQTETGVTKDLPAANAVAAVLSGYWSNKSGGESQTTATKVYRGGSPWPVNLPSVYAVNDLTISRPYDFTTDPAFVSALRPLVGRWFVRVTVTPTDADYNPKTPVETYHGMLTGVTPPTVDASSGAAATLTLTFSIAWVG